MRAHQLQAAYPREDSVRAAAVRGVRREDSERGQGVYGVLAKEIVMAEEILPSFRPFEDAWAAYFARGYKPVYDKYIFKAGYDACLANWAAELAVKDDLIRQLSERVAICSELLAKRAERHRDPR